MPESSPTAAAERQRRYRTRRRRGVVVSHAEVPVQLMDALINDGDLTETDTTDATGAAR